MILFLVLKENLPHPSLICILICTVFFFFFKHLPTSILMQILKINPEKKNIDSFVASDFELIGYDPHEKIEMKMAV